MASRRTELNFNPQITAPVSNWSFYDAFYTERYMKLPSTNEENYSRSAVHDATGFRNVRGGVLLQHGTGDDNVHFQNSAVLVDLLMSGGVQTTSIDESIHRNVFDELGIDRRIHKGFDENFLLNSEGVEADTAPPAPQKGVSPSKLHVQWFTDSDHGISFHGSRTFLWKQMARWLWKEKNRVERKDGEAEGVVHQWDL